MLRKAVAVACAAVSLCVTAATPVSAQAAVAYGLTCRFTLVTDPSALNSEVRSGEVDGGPLVATAPLATARLTCTIQVGTENATHGGADACSGAFTSIQVVALAPTPCTLILGSGVRPPAAQPVYVCTQLTVSGGDYFWDSPTEEWTRSSGASCAEAVSQELAPGPLGPVFEIVNAAVDDYTAEWEDATWKLIRDSLFPLTVIVCPIVGC